MCCEVTHQSSFSIPDGEGRRVPAVLRTLIGASQMPKLIRGKAGFQAYKTRGLLQESDTHAGVAANSSGDLTAFHALSRPGLSP